jgi:plasmid stability protein
MATIQVRDIPEPIYEVIRRRARAEGKSIQAYMRERVIDMASKPSKDEAVKKIRAFVEKHGPVWSNPEDMVRDIHAERRY